jgi:methylase of polypeptide subunit release factors
MSAGAAFPKAALVGVDIDPLATLLARANLAVAGLGDRVPARLPTARTSS